MFTQYAFIFVCLFKPPEKKKFGFKVSIAESAGTEGNKNIPSIDQQSLSCLYLNCNAIFGNIPT